MAAIERDRLVEPKIAVAKGATIARTVVQSKCHTAGASVDAVRTIIVRGTEPVVERACEGGAESVRLWSAVSN